MLYRRYIREFIRNPGIYIAIFLIIAVGLGTVLGGNAGDDSMIAAVEDFLEEANLSDGYVTVVYPLTKQELEQAKEEGMEIEESFFLDMDSEKGELRIFQNRDKINQAYIREGKLPEKSDEVFLEKHYCEANDYQVGDIIEIGAKKYKITGIGSLPDYINVLKKSADMSSHTDTFSVASITEDAFTELEMDSKNSGKITYQYNFICQNGMNIDDANNFFRNCEKNQVIEFVNSEMDARVITYKEDCAMVKRATFVFAIVLLLVIAYVMGVFLKNRVEKESKIIGTLSALGYRKRELILHYLGMPILTSILGGVGALICGYFVFSKMLTQDSVDLYSMPDFHVFMPMYIILFGVIVPALIMGIIGFFMLNGKIADCPEKIMKPEGKTASSSLKLEKVSYINAFRIRQFIKEISGNLVMIGGVFVATILLLLGFSIYSSVSYYEENVLKDVTYQYLYFVSGNQELPKEAEKVQIEDMKCESEVEAIDLNVTLYGVESDSRYFVKIEEKASKENVFPVVISDAFARKCNLKTEDTFSVSDHAKTNVYHLVVVDIIPYSNGLSLFMDRKELNNMLGEETGNYNAVVSSTDLSNSNFNYLSCVKAQEYREAAKSMLDSLMLIIVALLGSAALIFVMVIYLMVKFMMDKAKNNISLLKILGYHTREVNRIYLGGETYVVILAILLSLPLGKGVISLIFPYLTAGYSVYLNPFISLAGYWGLVGFMFLAYYVVYLYLKKKLKKIELAEVLKERE